MMSCTFCDIVAGGRSAAVVLDDEVAVAFLDHRPLFPGHVLVVPRNHVETLEELPDALAGAFFNRVKLLAAAVRTALTAEGTFVAMNNRVSQSVPHLHVHVVPRRRKDGLRGFFWPRRPYGSDEEISLVQDGIRLKVAELGEGMD
jgi:histidine triad (HIT) family protein